ncbi:DEAD/DEAH box helicase [Candidatus Nanosalina sp. VS9-1]|uniref:DEAD/DEAH box helicase n=1 Tax=Candidatus Nanosalina sp. VS9-1 TaxID=3388566 RepID=UPI0039E0074B
MNFEELGISERTVSQLKQQGITEPTEVQKKSIPEIFEGKDMLVESETGSGKTLAFSLPIIEKVSGDDTKALVLTPTRELAKQVSEEIEKNSPDKIETVTIYGGVSYDPQIQGAKKANIVVGTPGRVLDLLKQKKIDVSGLEYFILDEADRMLDMGFQDELEQIISFLPDEKQNLLFGATIPRALKKMCDRYDIEPETIRIKASEHTRNLDAKYMNVKKNEKLSTLYTLLEERERDLSIVFCQTKNTTRWLADKLRKNGIDAQELNGDMSQHKREEMVEKFENGEIKVIVATDVAARGLDIDNVTHVFNYDVPDTADTYTHRIGRAGRQGREGEAITLLERNDHDKFRRIKRKVDIPRMDEEVDLKDAKM